MKSLIPRNNKNTPQITFVPLFGFFGSFWRPLQNWLKRRRCPKCGGKNCLQYHSEVVKDKVVGHSRDRFGSYRSWYGRTNDDPFIREWVEERYICQKCGRHVSIEVTRDRY